MCEGTGEGEDESERWIMSRRAEWCGGAKSFEVTSHVGSLARALLFQNVAMMRHHRRADFSVFIALNFAPDVLYLCDPSSKNMLKSWG